MDKTTVKEELEAVKDQLFVIHGLASALLANEIKGGVKANQYSNVSESLITAILDDTEKILDAFEVIL